MPKIDSLTVRLKEQLLVIENQMLELLDASTIEQFQADDPFDEDPVVFIGPRHYWAETDESQKRLQLKLRRSYFFWFEQFQLLFCESSQELQKQIATTHTAITDLIEQKSGWSTPSTVEEAKLVLKEKIQTYGQLLQLLEAPDQAKPVLVPDTNALITCPDVSHYATAVGQAEYAVVIIPTVLAELDKLKRDHRDIDFRKKVDSVIRRLKGLRQQGSMLQGVTINKTVTVRMIAPEPNFSETLSWLDPTNNDDRIIATVLELQREEPSNTVVLVTSDINLQNKAEMANIPYVEPPAP